ncbi:MAG: hypothetical protein GXO89_01080 [Chlorobi bacterium]|nr:hypothetical protein [Chlorobiota bacterium]
MEKETVNEPLSQYGRPVGFDQVWQMFQETDKKFKETDKMLSEKFRETDKKLNKLEQLFTSQWGKLVESLVEGDLVNVLNKRGIRVEKTIQRIKGNHKGENFEYDIIAVNGKEIVIVEVKTTLRGKDVEWFHEKLWKAKNFLPEYEGKTIYGAMAFITADGSSDCMAEKLGFFAIRATGNSSSIINEVGFQPKAF